MAGKFGPSSVVITLDDAPGGTSRTITPFVETIGEVGIEQITDQVNPFGVAYSKHSPINVQQVPDIPIGGWFDTTATTGPHTMYATPDTAINDGTTATTRTFTFSPGDSKVFTMECIVAKYTVIATLGKLQRYTAVLRQAGSAAWT